MQTISGDRVSEYIIMQVKDGQNAELPFRVAFMCIRLWTRAIYMYKGKLDDHNSFYHTLRTNSL